MVTHPAKFLFGIIAILYPLLVFCALVIFKLPIKYLSIGIIVFAIAYSVVNSRHYRGKRTIALFISPLILCAIGAVSLRLEDEIVIKLYPALADLAYLTIMITSFIFPPPLAYYFINIFDKTMKKVIPRQRFELYCFRASIVWCVYFVLDGIVSILTVYIPAGRADSNLIWGAYNAGITYIIMGMIFAGEFIILKIKLKKYRLRQAEASRNDPPPA
jgi:uncharacterized membrane protein